MSVASITYEDPNHEFEVFNNTLNEEQVVFQQHAKCVRTWASAAHEEFFCYNSKRLAAIDAVVSQHMQSHFPIMCLHDARAALQAVGLCVNTYADKVGVDANNVHNVMLANLSYFGLKADSVIMDMLHIMATLMGDNPSRSCAIVIFPNAWSLPTAVTNTIITQQW